MTHECYQLTDSEIQIEDPELGIFFFRSLGEFSKLADPLLEKEGLVIETDAAGRRSAAYAVSEEQKHGHCRLFYPDGQIKAEMYYYRGTLHGPCMYFSLKNEKLAETKLAETWYAHGRKVGKVKFFYPSGQLCSLQRYNHGAPNGLQEYWYADGRVKSLIPYVEGAMHGEVRLFWESGQFKRSCSYAKGLREGWDRLWNENGILIEEGEFKQGQPAGIHRQFFIHGKIKQELYYHTAVRYDCKEWNDEGKLLREGLYSPDLSYTERTFVESSRTEVRKGYWDGKRLCWK